MLPAHPSTEQPTGLIFDIQAHSVHDGPGTRTTVFLNGCPFSCEWCCNPEGLHRRPVVMHREQRCVHCGGCARACPRGAISLGADGLETFDRSLCADCATYDCVSACYHEGNVLSGKRYTVDQLMDIFRRDRQFWGRGGGVTFSGGEPLLQRDFMLPLLRRCREARIHTCVETTACLPTDYFMEAAALLDFLFIDIKNMDPVAHRARTRADNAQTLRNVKTLGASDLDCFVVIRIPVIPGWNDGEENIRKTARFVRECGLEVINLLPFHRLSESKWRQVGEPYAFADLPGLSREELAPHAQWVREEGITCYTGWETPF
ncbi:glycyl-radical enzyme activating protein [Mesoterricola sediminis]|uniref:4-hydroxyphenylacetate decarboxylase activating enzyme n=1 Tax=Mesoterricola sediminis TaxID=2927980 RepID=A0AA48H1W6_9BACT|nr:glycyl-radical enzyme activating protein [Mesoterricola sediminis]BDU75961.1 4-hydroxyphenylacetate decarboxylase activating enzyme [Mesoterricola sediminis]